jgi:hypothetical protein
MACDTLPFVAGDSRPSFSLQVLVLVKLHVMDVVALGAFTPVFSVQDSDADLYQFISQPFDVLVGHLVGGRFWEAVQLQPCCACLLVPTIIKKRQQSSEEILGASR